MDINGIHPSGRMGQAKAFSHNQHPPLSFNNSINTFNQALHKQQENCGIKTPTTTSENTQQLTQLQQQQQLMQMLQGGITSGAQTNNPGNNIREASTSNPNGETYSITGLGTGISAGNDHLIPKPVEHLQTLNLGGKNLKIGSDGTSSALEVAATAAEIQHMYNQSQIFKKMIDQSSNPALDVSVGRRADNISWGNTDGRVFMNINNVNPDNSDRFQALMGHEFAHATIGMVHGSDLDTLQNLIAQEA